MSVKILLGGTPNPNCKKFINKLYKDLWLFNWSRRGIAGQIPRGFHKHSSIEAR